MQDYSQLVERISKATALSVEDIERRIEAKRAKLSGLISKEGAAQIVAAELGINFDKQKLKVNELMSGNKKVNIVGKIIRMFPVREFKKETREGKIGSFILADETGNIRVVLWDTNHIKMIEDGKIKENDIVEISNASLRNTELHLTAFSDIKLSQQIMEEVKSERSFFERKLNETRIGEAIKTRAFIVQAFEPKFFDVCPECGGRARQEADGSMCIKHGKVLPSKRVLMSIVLDDGSESLRAVLFSEQISKLGINPENFLNERENLIGREAFFSGTIRQNKLFNNSELFVSDIGEIEIEKLIDDLEQNR